MITQMSDLASQAAAQMDYRDTLVLILLERFNHEGVTRPNALAVMSHIKGAPSVGVVALLNKLKRLDAIELLPEPGNTTDYYVTELGSEVLQREVEGWEPSSRENKRREMYSRMATEATRS